MNKERNYSYRSQSRTFATSQWAELQSGNAAGICAGTETNMSMIFLSPSYSQKEWKCQSDRRTSVYTIQVSQPLFNNIRSWICSGLSSNRGTLQEPC
jgi:hypothetical protein